MIVGGDELHALPVEQRVDAFRPGAGEAHARRPAPELKRLRVVAIGELLECGRSAVRHRSTEAIPASS